MNEIHKIKNSADKKLDHGATLLEEAKGKVSEFAEGVKEKGEEILDEVKERGVDLWDDVQGQGKSAIQNLRTMIRKKPLESVGAAAVVGALFFALFLRRKD